MISADIRSYRSAIYFSTCFWKNASLFNSFEECRCNCNTVLYTDNWCIYGVREVKVLQSTPYRNLHFILRLLHTYISCLSVFVSIFQAWLYSTKSQWIVYYIMSNQFYESQNSGILWLYLESPWEMLWNKYKHAWYPFYKFV